MPNLIPNSCVHCSSYSWQKITKVMHLGIQVQAQHSSSIESISLSHQKLTAMDRTSSQDHSASSESVHDEGKNGPNMKSAMFACNLDLSTNVSQAEISQPMVQFSYAYPDPYVGGLFTAYAPHAMFQPQVMGAAAGRVPIPADLPDDGPIYVNAKQYHGIMRRRQIRAKLEAQNKLVKNRRPYLHESRHQHAVKRVRGTGGRFLSTKKPHHSDSNPAASSQNTPGPFHFSHMGTMENANEHLYVSNHHATPSAADIAVSSTDACYMVISMQDGYNGNRHYNASSIVR